MPADGTRLPTAKKRRVRRVSVLWAALQQAVTPHLVEVSLGPNVSVGPNLASRLAVTAPAVCKLNAIVRTRRVIAWITRDFRTAFRYKKRVPDWRDVMGQATRLAAG